MLKNIPNFTTIILQTVPLNPIIAICQDLVVGAPYEGRGVVYLYQGGPAGLNLKPSQLVR